MYIQAPDHEFQVFLDSMPLLRLALDPKSYVKHGAAMHEVTPRLLSRFDWCIDYFNAQHPVLLTEFPDKFALAVLRLIDEIVNGIPEHKHMSDPGTVLAPSTAIPHILKVAQHDFNKSRLDRVLVVHGDWPFLLAPNLTPEAERKKVIQKLRRYFNVIFYEGLDQTGTGLREMPFGVYDGYLRNGVFRSAWAAILRARVDEKHGEVLAAWGKFWNFEKVNRWPKIHVRGPAVSQSRKSARLWSQTPEAKRAGVELRDLTPAEWWATLPDYKFILAPMGINGGTPKTIEALLVLTIPIVHGGPFIAADELVTLGFPIVVITRWAQVTPANLTLWWTNLSPRLESFRHRCLNPDGYWRLLTTSNYTCW